MAKYGYRVMELIATPPNKSAEIAFTDPEPSGLRDAVLTAAKAAMASGERNDQRGMYTRVTNVKDDAWGVLLTVKGGQFGEPRELLDVDSDDPDEPTRPIGPSDAVLSDLRVLLLIPPYGSKGLVVAETRSRSQWISFVLRRLNLELRSVGVKLRTVRDTTDAIAWGSYLSRDEVGIKSVELIQTNQSVDRTRFTSENVKSARLQLNIADGSELKRRLSAILQGLSGETVRRPRLAGVVGLRADFSDEDFDEEKIVIVDGEREQKISVSGGWPLFTYTFDTDYALSDAEFVDGVLDIARRTLEHMNVDVATNWRPRID